jgi:hypothetical protein
VKKGTPFMAAFSWKGNQSQCDNNLLASKNIARLQLPGLYCE